VANSVRWAEAPGWTGWAGSDWTHALAAWTSTYRELSEDKILRMPTLLKKLGTEGHHTPFERSMLHFLVTCDTASHIHILKHRIGVSVNGESARYKELKEDKYYVPEDWPLESRLRLHAWMQEAYCKYHDEMVFLTETLGRKRAKESARFFLPYANQLTLDVSFNFRSFTHFLGLRKSEHAQKEINDIATEMLELVKGTGAFDSSLAAFGY